MSDNTSNQKVSIIIPVYNVSEYLERCLNSILNQTYDNIEIVLIDD
ncbi:MAG: glycosyltransferase family 2 protein, partial [Acutalibacteraceae bacterium]